MKKLFLLLSIIFCFTTVSFSQLKQEPPVVTFKIEKPDKVKAGKSFEIKVDFQTLENWYIHAPTGVNKKEGMIETVVSFKCPDGIKTDGIIQFPPPIQKGVYQIYKGEDIVYKQTFLSDKKYKKQNLELLCTVEYQTCNSSLCKPPVTEEIKLKIKLK